MIQDDDIDAYNKRYYNTLLFDLPFNPVRKKHIIQDEEKVTIIGEAVPEIKTRKEVGPRLIKPIPKVETVGETPVPIKAIPKVSPKPKPIYKHANGKVVTENSGWKQQEQAISMKLKEYSEGYDISDCDLYEVRRKRITDRLRLTLENKYAKALESLEIRFSELLCLDAIHKLKSAKAYHIWSGHPLSHSTCKTSLDKLMKLECLQDVMVSQSRMFQSLMCHEYSLTDKGVEAYKKAMEIIKDIDKD